VAQEGIGHTDRRKEGRAKKEGSRRCHKKGRGRERKRRLLYPAHRTKGRAGRGSGGRVALTCPLSACLCVCLPLLCECL
jgi:hypothetical protein